LHELDPASTSPPDEFPALNLDGAGRDEFLLVLDFFESVGLRLTPHVIHSESQNSDITVNQDALARKYDLHGAEESLCLFSWSRPISSCRALIHDAIDVNRSEKLICSCQKLHSLARLPSLGD
jgi:hypothetical protein